jgi:hypothetical protein
MNRLRLASLVVTAALSVASAAAAHHGWSGYDASKEMTLDGVIKDPL